MFGLFSFVFDGSRPVLKFVTFNLAGNRPKTFEKQMKTPLPPENRVYLGPGFSRQPGLPDARM
jgi:hypothetical protein